MDDTTELKLRIMALEDTIRKMDRLLVIVCKSIGVNNIHSDKHVQEAAKKYLDIFEGRVKV